MRAGLYAISMPVTDLLNSAGLGGYLVSEMPVQVSDWEGLRRDVTEGQEIMLVGSVPEREGVICLHAIVIEFDDDQRLMRVVV